MIPLKSPREVEAIGRSGRIVARLFREIAPLVVPGVSTAQLDHFAGDFVRSHAGAVPAFKGLYGFPGNACVSINEEVVHGLPSGRLLREGDIVSVDVGVRCGGWCADSAFTFPVGAVGPEAAHLLDTTRSALDAAVAAARPGGRVGDVGAAVVEVVRGTGLSIVRDLVGHGIGRDIHEDPQVANEGRPGTGVLLSPGMVLAIEPMLSAGNPRIRTLADEWTVVTADRALSAHFEHTVAVTSTGPVVLTGGDIWERAAPAASVAPPAAPTRQQASATA